MTEINKVEAIKQIIFGDDIAAKPSSFTFCASISMVTSKAAFQKITTKVTIKLGTPNEKLVIELSSDEIDKKVFPEIVTVKPQDIEFITDEYIKILGYNYLNNNIGNFLLLIAPI